MSTILKALERLEKEKQGGAPKPGSAAELSVVRPGVPQEPSRRWLWVAGGIGALALTGVLAVWLRPLVEAPGEASSGAESGLAAPAPAAAPAPPVPVPAPAAAPAPPAPSPAAAAVPDAQAPAPGAPPEQVAPPVQPPTPPDPALQAAAPPPAEPARPPAPAPLATAELVAEASPTLSGVDPIAPAPAAEPAPEPAPIGAPEPAPAVAEPSPAPPPPAREVVRPRPTAPKPRPAPAVARAPEPKVVVERTVWHPDAARRRAWVRLEGRPSTELREGDSLGGIAVRRIEPSGVVFVAEGRELRRVVGALP